MRKKEAPVGENSGVPADVAEKTKEISLIDENLLKSKVYTIRGVKVMLDADLAEIYGYSVKAFNQQVKNNSEKFPEDFRFQLSREDLDFCSRSKILTLNGGSRGSNLKYRPYAFTEQGIYMLMTVLKGDLATKQSIAIVRLFKDMKDYIAAENQQLLGCANCTQIATLTARHSHEIAEIRTDVSRLEVESLKTQESLGKVMEYFHDPSTYKHRAIVNGLRLDADVAYTQIYGFARESIFVFDDYVGVKTLDYGTEREKMFHCGASSKDAGGRVTSINQIEHPEVYHPLMEEVLLLPDLP